MKQERIDPSKILNSIFSITTEYKNNIRRKKIKIFGLKISITLKRKVLLICRFDGIGDYILMRKFLKYVRYSKKYRNYKIIFAGRVEFAKFAEKYDGKYVDEFIWIPCSLDPEVLKIFTKIKADDVISPIYGIGSNDIDIQVIKRVKAKKIYGHNRLDKINKYEKKYYKYYTDLISTGNDIIFEQERYRLFFEQVLGENIPKNTKDELLISPLDLRSDFILVGPFSGAKLRTWDENNFIKVIDYITEVLKYKVGIIGSEYEIAGAEEIIRKVANKENVINLAGKISISEFPIYLRYAKMLITNETGTVHIAKIAGVKTICISNGSYMNRFQPYVNQNYIHYIYPDNINEYINEHHEVGEECSCDINMISADNVISLLNKIL